MNTISKYTINGSSRLAGSKECNITIRGWVFTLQYYCNTIAMLRILLNGESP
jgi:hypothetical protein